jgi:hypothetical protein
MAPRILLAMDRPTHWYTKVKHEQRHRDSEDPIAQGRKSFQALSRDTVVNCAHWTAPSSQFEKPHLTPSLYTQLSPASFSAIAELYSNFLLSQMFSAFSQ